MAEEKCPKHDVPLKLRRNLTTDELALACPFCDAEQQAQDKNLSATHVIVPREDGRTIVGYITLVSSVVPLSDYPPSLKRVSDKPNLPALLLAKMAVDSAHKGKDLGEFLLKHALVTARQMKDASGCFLVVVDAKDENSKNFYVKYGFTPFPDRNLRLFMPMKTIDGLMR